MHPNWKRGDPCTIQNGTLMKKTKGPKGVRERLKMLSEMLQEASRHPVVTQTDSLGDGRVAEERAEVEVVK